MFEGSSCCQSLCYMTQPTPRQHKHLHLCPALAHQPELDPTQHNGGEGLQPQPRRPKSKTSPPLLSPTPATLSSCRASPLRQPSTYKVRPITRYQQTVASHYLTSAAWDDKHLPGRWAVGGKDSSVRSSARGHRRSEKARTNRR